jgi:branched-chain amino acid transport system ATP-binding protein
VPAGRRPDHSNRFVVMADTAAGPVDSLGASGRPIPRLSIRNLVRRFGGLTALAGINLDVGQGEILGLIGPNGSGKTTLVNCVSGVHRVTAGSVYLDGKDVTGWSRVRRARSGLARTFQNLRLFRELTVIENVEVAQAAAGVRKKGEAGATPADLIARLGLEDKARTVVSRLPSGIQRRVEIARALATMPRVLLVDEPAAGLNDGETAELRELLKDVRDEFGCSILLIDHDMSLVLRVADRVQVLDEGKTIFTGRPDQAFKQPRVVEAYLGIQ